MEARGAVVGARVLDLFAGSGALGLEAASRGAAEVVLVESSRQAAVMARRNVVVVGTPRVSVVLSSVEGYLTGRSPVPADLVLADPPYWLSEADLATVLEALVAGWLAQVALVVVERSGRSPEPRWPARLVRSEIRRYGETAMWHADPGPGATAGRLPQCRSAAVSAQAATTR